MQTLSERITAGFQAVAADVKALLVGKVNNDDQRLSDSREWIASVVSRAEAEAGTATTARKWTAQRVRQAINAWWQLVTSGFGRNFIAASNEQAARNALQLGTAASMDVGTAAGNVMGVGAFGLGSLLNPPVLTLAQINDTFDYAGGMYQADETLRAIIPGNPSRCAVYVNKQQGVVSRASLLFAPISAVPIFYTVAQNFAVSPLTTDLIQAGLTYNASNQLGLGTTPTSARAALELGTAATANVTTSSTDPTAGRLLKVGDFGLGNNETNAVILPNNAIDNPPGTVCSGFYRYTTDTSGRFAGLSNNGCVLALKRNVSGGEAMILFTEGVGSVIPRMFFNARGTAAWPTFLEVRSTGNTTVDSNGFIKAASPIINLHADKIERNDALEVAEVQFERESTGVYLLTDCPPLSDDGWYLEQPRDRNGQVYHNIEWYYDDAARTLRIESFARLWNPATGQYDNGAPVDIKEGRFVALRFAEDASLYPEPELKEEAEAAHG